MSELRKLGRSLAAAMLVLGLLGGVLGLVQLAQSCEGTAHAESLPPYNAPIHSGLCTFSVKSGATVESSMDCLGKVLSNAASGADAFAVTTNGARFHFGTNVNEYADATGGGSITFHSNVVGQTSFAADQFASRQATNGPTIFSGQSNSGTAVGVIVDTFPSTFSTAGAKLFSIRNFGTEKAFVDKDGAPTFNGNVNAPNYFTTANGAFRVQGTVGSFGGAPTDGATAVGLVLNSYTALTTAGAKIASFQNNTVEKAFVDKDGKGSFAGANMNSQPLTGVGSYSAATDAPQVTFLEASVSGWFPAATFPTGNLTVGAWLDKSNIYTKAKEIAVTIVTAGSACSGSFTVGFVDNGTGSSLCSISVTASGLAGVVTSGACAATVPGTNLAAVYLTKGTAACTTWPAVVINGTISTF